MLLPLAALAPALLGAIAAPITSVTVYSDRARVTRTASVTVHGTESFELPLLLDSVSTRSIRLEAHHADVRRIDIAPVAASDVPDPQVRTLRDQIQHLDDQVTTLRAEDEAYVAELHELQRLTPSLEPVTNAKQPLPKLNAGGWASVFSFSDANEEKIEAHRREFAEKIEALGRDRAKLAEQARLLGGTRLRAGFKVTALVAGNGPAELMLTYEMGHARWYPSYDVSLAPEKGQVRVSLAGQVSQETGEDWSGAGLTLSTAIPSGAQAFPHLLTWKIGDKERFIPTPVAMVEPQQPQGNVRGGLDSDRDGIADQEDDKKEYRSEDKPVIRLKDIVITGEASGAGAAQEQPTDAPMAAPAPAAPSPPPPPMEVRSLEERTAMPSAPGRFFAALGGKHDESAPMSSTNVGLSPPVGYVRPVYAPNLPASLAGGYDLAFRSAQVETIASGGGPRRVALLSQTWPVTVERQVFPALNPEAFLIAELASPSPTALPGGTANLFVGDDPAGVAQLKLIAPGEKVTLPLGLDRAVRPIRNVQLVEAEKGLISKDEVTRYDVTTEIANPYPAPMAVRVLDQWPLSDQEELKVALESTTPYALQDPVKGTLEWHIVIPPGGKSTVSFTYSLRRPKGWRLHQL